MVHIRSVAFPKHSLMLILTVTALAGGSMTSCASVPNESTSAPGAVAETAAPVEGGQEDQSSLDNLQRLNDNSQSASELAAPRRNPQLIKTANLTVQVEDMEVALDLIDQLLIQQQGDLLSLEESQFPRGERLRSSLKLRVPQQRLSQALKGIEDLGKVKTRSIQAKDVSNQIIDNQARLKNLRKSEEMVLKIMERSGSIPDVLSASQELSSIRERIERIDAQVQNLQSQVAFSTINLQLETLAPAKNANNNLGTQLSRAWRNSTGAMADLTLSLVKLFIWGVAFSPYLGGICLFLWLGQRTFRNHQNKTSELPSE